MKVWYQSVAVWVNLVSFLTLAAALMNTGDYASLFTPDVLKYIGLVVALLNIAVRVFVTQVPIKKSLV
jgi:hypothetical protein